MSSLKFLKLLFQSFVSSQDVFVVSCLSKKCFCVLFSDNPGHMIKIIAAIPNFKESYPLEPNAKHRNTGAPVLL